MLDERNIYDSNYVVYEAKNEIVMLSNSAGEKKKCIDLISAYGACNFGHNNEKINHFLKDFKSDICAAFYPKEAFEFSEWILKKLNITNYEVLFQVGGSFAVSTALSIAQHERNGKVVHLDGAFHGLGLDSLTATVAQKNMAIQNSYLGQSLENQFINLKPHSDEYLDIKWDEVSSFIFEPIQGANGYLPLDTAWIIKVIDYARSFGVVIIADEIQCGYFRHGVLSISASNNFNPDIFLFSKSLTNGIYPYSAVIYRKELKEKLVNDIYLSHTFQTSSLGCYAMMSVADYIDSNPIAEYCSKIKTILNAFKSKLEEFSFIKDVHVLESTLSFGVTQYKAKDIVFDSFTENVLIFTGGVNGDRIRIAPPLTIPEESLVKALDTILNIINKLKK